jgi:hypothetical protein
LVERQWATAGKMDLPAASFVAAMAGPPSTGPDPRLLSAARDGVRPIQSTRSWSHASPDLSSATWPPVRKCGVGWDWGPTDSFLFEMQISDLGIADPSVPLTASGTRVVTGTVHMAFDGIVAERLLLPMTPVAAIAAAPAVARLTLVGVRRWRRVRPSHCRRCGYDLRASPCRCGVRPGGLTGRRASPL